MSPTLRASTKQANRPLRKLLSDKDLYTEEDFANRVTTLDDSKLEDCQVNEGLSLLTPSGKPFLLAISCPSERTPEALARATEYIAQSETIGLLVVHASDTQDHTSYRRRFDSNVVERIADLESYFLGGVGAQSILFEGAGVYETNSPRSDDAYLLPISNKLENLFFDIHSVMRDVDGLHADAALEELCKLIYVKAFAEEQGLQGVGFVPHSREFGSTEEYAATIRGLYRDSVEYDLRVFRLKIPQYDRSRGVFKDPIRLSSSALVKSFQVLENFSLKKSTADVKGRAFQKVLGRAIRSGMGQYFTPAAVCQFMVNVVQPQIHHLILDPFCGSGHFLSLSLAAVAQRNDPSSRAFHEFAFGKLHGIEKSDRMTRIAMTDMRLSGDGHSNIRCADSLLHFDNYPDIAPDSFDIVLTNPPFGSLLGSDSLAHLGTFELARGRKTVGLEVLGLERAVAFLRPGGRLAIVLPESVFSADSTAYVRQWIRTRLKVRAVVSMPIETFSPFGANVKTSVLFARKWKPGEVVGDDYDVCMVKLESVGYDASGRSKAHTDITEVQTEILSFLKTEGW